MHGQLEHLEQWLGRAVGDAIATALAIDQPAGMSGPWLAILRGWGVAALAPDERDRIAGATGLQRGAPIDELYGVVDAIARRGRDAHRRIACPDDSPGQRRWERLQHRLDDMRDQVIAFYQRRVLGPPPSSMFAYAIASAQRGGSATAPAVAVQPFILRCTSCGAPRMDDRSFECQFCGRHLGGRDGG